MNVDDFRRIALSLPDGFEGAHMGHPDFRVRGKIFATIWPDESCGMVKHTIEQQAVFMQHEPEVFVPVNGRWGRKVDKSPFARIVCAWSWLGSDLNCKLAYNICETSLETFLL